MTIPAQDSDDVGAVTSDNLYTDAISTVLLATREAVMAPIRGTLHDDGLTEQQFRMLRVLAAEGSIDARTLAHHALLHAASVSRILKQLVGRKLIQRAIDPADTRRSIIAITGAGLDVFREHCAHVDLMAKNYELAFGYERLEALKYELRAFAEAVRPFGPRKSSRYAGLDIGRIANPGPTAKSKGAKCARRATGNAAQPAAEQDRRLAPAGISKKGASAPPRVPALPWTGPRTAK